MVINCLTCGHPKWKHYKLFEYCTIRGCDCRHFKTKPFIPLRRRR